MTPWPRTAASAANHLCQHAIICGIAALLLLALGPLTIGVPGLAARLSWLALSVLCLVAIGFSVHLLFDAALFRLAASYRDEAAGVAAIDDVLMRMVLRKPATGRRSLGDRIAGSRRIVWKQRVVLAACLLPVTCLVLIAANGWPPC